MSLKSSTPHEQFKLITEINGLNYQFYNRQWWANAKLFVADYYKTFVEAAAAAQRVKEQRALYVLNSGLVPFELCEIKVVDANYFNVDLYGDVVKYIAYKDKT